MVGCPVSVKVVPVNECIWHPFSVVQFVNTDHIFSSSLIILFVDVMDYCHDAIIFIYVFCELILFSDL